MINDNNISVIYEYNFPVCFTQTIVFTMPVAPIDGLLGTEQQTSIEHTGKGELQSQSTMKN